MHACICILRLLLAIAAMWHSYVMHIDDDYRIVSKWMHIASSSRCLQMFGGGCTGKSYRRNGAVLSIVSLGLPRSY